MPDWKTVVRQRLARLDLAPAAESDLAEELAQHLEDRYRELCRGGATEHAAYREALSELDDSYPVPSRPKWNLEGAGGDLRYALRTIRKSPMFVLFVVMTLALGIGANTTVFTVINTLLLNPLPVARPVELTAIAGASADSTTRTAAPSPISHADLRDYQGRNEVFDSLAGFTTPRTVTWQEGGASQALFSELATANYFSTLGLTPAKGRFFLPEEDSTPGAHAVAVVSYATWQKRFGGAGDILGRKLRLNNVVFTVIGVAPPKFIGVNIMLGPDVWLPAPMAEQMFPNEMEAAWSDRSKTIFQGVGRLKPGVTVLQAQANLTAIAANLAREYPAANQGHTVTVRPVLDILFAAVGGGSTPIRLASVILLLVVGIVLLIACSNVANLLLARSAARQQELAIRVAMGASRGRLLRQLLTESVLMGLLSGAIGLAMGYAGLKLLFGVLPGSGNFVTPKLDATVFVFALVISLATGFLFGIIPAMKASRTSVADALKQEARIAGRSRSRVNLSNALLIGQVGFSFLLLVTAALFLRSIGRAYQLDPGFQTSHLAVFLTSPGQAGYNKSQTKAFYQDVREHVKRLPGVESVSWASNMPLWSRPVSGLQVEGRQARSQADQIRGVVHTVDRNYFETAGVAIDSGRGFEDQDLETSTPVAIVNEKTAHDFWPGGAIGKRIGLPGEKQMRRIVGVARNANYSTWGEPPQGCVYVPLEQNYSAAMILYVRSKGDPQGVLSPVEHEIRTAAPQLLTGRAWKGSEIVYGGLFFPRMGVILLSVFGLLALGLASIGLYGIVAYSVQQRKRELGLRMALGASQGSVLGLILKQGMSLVLTGILLGFGAALFAGRLLSRMLYGVGASDPLSVAGAAVTLSAIALLACYLPARWATRVDPLAALREG